jgi:hypothetical protein
MSPPSRRHYAIPSARAVVQALIVGDRDAAEEAALRTCRDCDLLIHLVWDLALRLRACAPGRMYPNLTEVAALVRRVDQVLTLVECQATEELLSGQHLSDPGGRKGPSPNRRGGKRSKAREHGCSPMALLQARPAPTVASLGLRVRLIPESDDGNPIATVEEGQNNRSEQAPSGPRSDSVRR